jgi:tetratricopeptide (TPR) repeat protein
LQEKKSQVPNPNLLAPRQSAYGGFLGTCDLWLGTWNSFIANSCSLSIEKSFSENYSKGIEYYNKGIDIINKQTPDKKILALDEILTDAIVQFKLALPYLEKAHELNPKDKNTLTALMGIYFAMHETEKYNKYKREFESLNKK